MKFTRHDPGFESYTRWHALCPEGTYRVASPDELKGLLPIALLDKTNSVLLMGSASPDVSVWMANLNRIDWSGSAIDQQPYIAAFMHSASSASGGFLHHGTWVGRTTRLDGDLARAIAASGIQAHFPLSQMPTLPAGSLDKLQVSSQGEAFWQSFEALQHSAE